MNSERDYCLYVDGCVVGFTPDFRVAYHTLSMLRCLTLDVAVKLVSIPCDPIAIDDEPAVEPART